MESDLTPLLTRIATALERLAPPPANPVRFESARIFRHDARRGMFHPASDYPLPLACLVGVERQ